MAVYIRLRLLLLLFSNEWLDERIVNGEEAKAPTTSVAVGRVRGGREEEGVCASSITTR